MKQFGRGQVWSYDLYFYQDFSVEVWTPALPVQYLLFKWKPALPKAFTQST